jgi:hypothetical protein
MDRDEVWCRVSVRAPDGSELFAGVLSGRGSPDLHVVDALARLQLAVRRLGATLELRAMAPELCGLLEVTGLGGELGRQPEDGEDERSVEKGVEPGDAPA